MLIEAKVGPVTGTDASYNEVRLGRTSEVCVADAHSHFAEAASRGGIFTAANVAAGVAPGTALGTAAGLALWNPTNSGVNLVIVEWSLAWTSGTLGAGKLWHVLHAPATAAPTGTVVTPVSHKGNAGSPQGKAYSTVTALGAASAVRIAATVTALTADAGTAAVIREALDGLLVLPPGVAYSLQEVGAAGTTPLVNLSITWEEIPA